MSTEPQDTEVGGAGRSLDDYVSRTRDLGWISGEVRPLPGEGVIAVYEVAGAIKHVRTRYDPAQGGWLEPALSGRRFYWVYDPPV